MVKSPITKENAEAQLEAVDYCSKGVGTMGLREGELEHPSSPRPSPPSTQTSWTCTSRNFWAIFEAPLQKLLYGRSECASQLHTQSFTLLTDEQRAHAAAAGAPQERVQPVAEPWRHSQQHLGTSAAWQGDSTAASSGCCDLGGTLCLKRSSSPKAADIPRPAFASEPTVYLAWRLGKGSDQR